MLVVIEFFWSFEPDSNVMRTSDKKSAKRNHTPHSIGWMVAGELRPRQIHTHTRTPNKG